jgi:hypothetical protein
MKYIKVFAVLMLFLVSAMAVSATESDEFQIDQVIINGYNLNSDSDNNPFGPVYAGEDLRVEVFWSANDGFDEYAEARIVAELADEEEETDYFSIGNNWTGREILNFELDSEIDPGLYTLNIYMEDEEGNRNHFDVLRIDVVDQRNLVNIYDVNFPMGTTLQAGQSLFASVGVENIGHSEEEDIYVQMNIPALGLNTRSNRFDLVTEEVADDCEDGCDDEDYKIHKDLVLALPTNVPSGIYDVVVEVIYDNGDGRDTKSYSLTIGAGTAFGGEIDVDTTMQSAERGTAVAFWISYPNSNVNYDVVVQGVDFGTYRVAEESDGAYVFVSVDRNADAGQNEFTVDVMSGNEVLKSFDLTVDVLGPAGFGNVKDGLQLGFSILLVILVILGIIVAARKLRGDKEEPIIDEDQTYY